MTYRWVCYHDSFFFTNFFSHIFVLKHAFRRDAFDLVKSKRYCVFLNSGFHTQLLVTLPTVIRLCLTSLYQFYIFKIFRNTNRFIKRIEWVPVGQSRRVRMFLMPKGDWSRMTTILYWILITIYRTTQNKYWSVPNSVAKNRFFSTAINVSVSSIVALIIFLICTWNAKPIMMYSTAIYAVILNEVSIYKTA